MMWLLDPGYTYTLQSAPLTLCLAIPPGQAVSAAQPLNSSQRTATRSVRGRDHGVTCPASSRMQVGASLSSAPPLTDDAPPDRCKLCRGGCSLGCCSRTAWLALCCCKLPLRMPAQSLVPATCWFWWKHPGAEELEAFLGQLDALVVLLALTPETQGIVNARCVC